MSSIIDLLAKNIFENATVTHKVPIAPGTFHMKLESQKFKNYTYTAGEHLRLFVGIDKDTSLNEKLRTYSIWEYNTREGVVDIVVCTHSLGIGTAWAQSVQVGDTVYYMGPKGKLTTDHAGSSYLMIGDDSSLSHLYAIRRGVHATKKVRGLIYASEMSQLYADVDGSLPFTFFALPANPVGELIAQIDSIKGELSVGTIAYLAGDTRVCKTLSRYLRQDMKWDSWQVKSKGFWMPGKTGMD